MGYEVFEGKVTGYKNLIKGIWISRFYTIYITKRCNNMFCSRWS